MPVINANFADIQAFGDRIVFPAGTYAARIKKFNLEKSQEGRPMFRIEAEVTSADDSEYIGKPIFDRIALQKRDGSDNPVGLGQVKMYAIACIGEERANSPSGIDTDEFLNADVQFELKASSYEKDGKTYPSYEVVRVLPL